MHLDGAVMEDWPSAAAAVDAVIAAAPALPQTGVVSLSRSHCTVHEEMD
jgi:hypothetical protein